MSNLPGIRANLDSALGEVHFSALALCDGEPALQQSLYALEARIERAIKEVDHALAASEQS